jgi:hypothetical protein
VVKASGSTDSKRVRIQYKCVHYGVETQNRRGLKRYIERDSEGKPTT